MMHIYDSWESLMKHIKTIGQNIYLQKIYISTKNIYIYEKYIYLWRRYILCNVKVCYISKQDHHIKLWIFIDNHESIISKMGNTTATKFLESVRFSSKSKIVFWDIFGWILIFYSFGFHFVKFGFNWNQVVINAFNKVILL